MKNKTLTILVAIFVLAMLAITLCACGPKEQSLDGMYVVTFDFDGGTLYNGSTNIRNQIHHAYQPNSKIIDIANYKNYKFTKSEKMVDGEGNDVKDASGNIMYTYYDFVGWFTDKERTQEWNFQTDIITVEKLTLYAKWIPQILYTYDVYYTDSDGSEKLLGSYRVEEGAEFSDSNKYAVNGLTKDKKTFVGFYSDKGLNNPWNNAYTHPGGEEDTSIPVYAKWIEGVWKLVSNYNELTSAFKAMSDNVDGIWLTADVDCSGQPLYVNRFDKTLRGDNDSGTNYKIFNFKIECPNVKANRPCYSIFGTLGATANLHDFDFENVAFEFENMKTIATPQIASLAQSVEVSDESICIVQNVHISGTYKDNNHGISIPGLDMDNMSDILANLVVEQDAAIEIDENVTSTFVEKTEA